jgi:hypothetical protein
MKRMRKFILMLVFTGLSVPVMAQDSQWFVQTNFSWNAWYAVGQKSLVAPFHKFPGGGGDGHTGWGLSLSGGRWMTSALALRTKLNMWQMGTKSDDGQKADKYWTLNEQLVFNLSSVLMGHNPYRFWNFMPYIGAGISRNMSAAHYTSNLSFGILNTFRLTPKLAGNFEIGWNSYEGNGGIALKDRLQQITFEFGVTWCFGTSKAKKKAEADAMESLSEGEIDALNAQLSDLEAENEQLRKELEEAKKVKNEK